jgi:S-(hydroxymethyl)glutathione dehydrogenase / alcohol dehydrogenase
MRAAVLRETGDRHLDIVDGVTLAPVGPGEVRVKVMATGLCHTDLSAMDGLVPAPPPSILGHEASGIVVEVGAGVQRPVVGDHVILSFVPPCGWCQFCLRGQPNLCIEILDPFDVPARFVIDGSAAVGLSGLGTFAEEVVVAAAAAIPIPREIPFDVASLIGCGVTTGVGAALNTAQVRPGSSVVVVGCGGVGLSVLQGAQVCGAVRLVAVDLSAERLEAAKRFGATDCCTPDSVFAVLDELNDGAGADYAFEAVGRPDTIRLAFDATRKGGTCVVVGAGQMDDVVEFTPFELFYFEKQLRGCLYGSSDVRTEFGRLLSLWKAGKLDLDGMITRRLRLDDLNDAIDLLRAGDGIRSVITFD